MPSNGFYSFLAAIVSFFQWIFAGVTRVLAPVYSLSPLPDALDFILICLLIVALVFAVFQSSPWNR